MRESTDIAEDAFVILKGWHWGHCDADGFQTHFTIPISDALNRLAFEEHADPASAILTLLGDGKLTASCDYEWSQFRNSQVFVSNGSNATIEPRKWQTLEDMLRAGRREGEGNEWAKGKVSLPELKLGSLKTVEWHPAEDRCSFAICSSNLRPDQDGYLEEHFTGRNIQLRLSSMVMEELHRSGKIGGSAKLRSKAVGQGMSSLSEADLLRWWKSKSNVQEKLSQDELLHLVRAKHPDKHVSRDRLRELIGPRKRGPKQFRG